MVDSSSLTLPGDPKEARRAFNPLEREGLKPQHLLAFQDFCLDFFEEKYGKVSPEKMDPRFFKELLIRK